MASFYQVWIEPTQGKGLLAVQRKMDLALDWYRMETNYWILYTNSNVQTWFKRLEPIVKPDGFLFICKLDITERQGWMPKPFWKWLRSKSVGID